MNNYILNDDNKQYYIINISSSIDNNKKQWSTEEILYIIKYKITNSGTDIQLTKSLNKIFNNNLTLVNVKTKLSSLRNVIDAYKLEKIKVLKDLRNINFNLDKYKNTLYYKIYVNMRSPILKSGMLKNDILKSLQNIFCYFYYEDKLKVFKIAFRIAMRIENDIGSINCFDNKLFEVKNLEKKLLFKFVIQHLSDLQYYDWNKLNIKTQFDGIDIPKSIRDMFTPAFIINEELQFLKKKYNNYYMNM